TAIQACLSAIKLVKANKLRAKLKAEKRNQRAKQQINGISPGDQGQARVDELIAGQLQYINAKRVRRQVLNLTTQFTSIAGDIATLSGVGATVGVGLKAAASGTQLGAKGLRTLNQFGRNRAA